MELGITSNKNWICDLRRQVHTSRANTVDVYEHFSEDTRCTAHREQKNDRTGEHAQDLRSWAIYTLLMCMDNLNDAHLSGLLTYDLIVILLIA